MEKTDSSKSFTFDSDIEPKFAPYLSIKENNKFGRLQISTDQLYCLDPFCGPICIPDLMSGYEKRGFVFLNAAFFDFLMENQELIPEHWKEEHVNILFLGTVFIHEGIPRYRWLFWNKSHWVSNYWVVYDMKDPFIFVAPAIKK